MNSTPKFIVEIIKKYWKPGDKILEIGCGPAFLREFFGHDYIGVDVTDEPYNSKLCRNVDVVCSAENLLIDNDSIDIIVIKSSFYLFTNHLIALLESQRVLKSKGMILIFDYNKRVQKKLQKSEAQQIYPCWTQWGLKRKLKEAGYACCKILSSNGDESSLYQTIKNELIGCWAIVMGQKI